MVRRVAAVVVVALGVSAIVNAQDAATAQSPTTSNATDDGNTRPATTTFFGDTGLWFVPTAEILSHGQWSVTGYRRGTNYIQGYTNVADFAGTFAVGIRDRAEVFGSFLFDTRIDRDVRPLFVNDPSYGGFIDRYPRVNTTWTNDHLGDFYVGAKVNVLSESRANPVAFAVRGIVKLPTGNSDVGNGTGKPDVLFDVIASKEVSRFADVSSYVGWEFRGKPDGFDTPSGAFRWGAGVGFPSRGPLRVSGELNGVIPSSGTASISGVTPLMGIDGSVSSLVSNTENITRATGAITYQAPKGFFLGVGLSWNVPRQERLTGHADSDDYPFGDYWDWQLRIGFHPGVRRHVPPPPPLSTPPSPIAAAQARQHNLSVKAQCDPCTVEVGQRSTVTAIVQDSINCVVTYRWNAPAGAFANESQRQTPWTAADQTGSIPVTVTVTCPSDGKTASDTVSITVTRPPVKTYAFDDVYFDFDRYSLRPDADRVLDEAVSALSQDPTLRVRIEGHTCNIGTAEYNLALGERRAAAVRAYLMGRGVSNDRLTIVSYGEEAPKYDNAREETRRLNRRAALVVNLQR
jgi:outer membrane protein OmpA-like peptidoglycan-associated protein